MDIKQCTIINNRLSLLEILPNSTCKMGCTFCRLDKSAQDMTTQEVYENVRWFRNEKNISSILISGGEPTLRDDFLSMMEGIQKEGIEDIRVISTGEKFSDPDFIQNLSISRVIISFSPNSLQELNTPHFIKIMQGIANLTTRKIPVQTNTVITHNNFSILDLIATILKKFNISSSILTFPFPTGAVKGKGRTLTPPYTIVRTNIQQFVDILSENTNSRIIIKGLPLCYLGEYKKYTCLTTNRYYVDYKRQFEKGVLFIPTELPFEYFSECSNCLDKKNCDGFWQEYLELPGFPILQANHG